MNHLEVVVLRMNGSVNKLVQNIVINIQIKQNLYWNNNTYSHEFVLLYVPVIKGEKNG